MRRFIDVAITILSFPIILFLCFFLSIFIRLESSGPTFFCSKRVGKNGNTFVMYKLRTMKIDAPLMPTSQAKIANYVTRLGRILRLLSLDELPQLLNILNGSMTLIGPRPCLKSQQDLINKRKYYGIIKMTPGLTGLAQIKGRDNLSIRNKIRYENFYLKNQSIRLNIYIFFMSFLKIFKIHEVDH